MRPESRQHGFGLVAAMFVIIIITAVITAMARLAETQNATNSLAIQQARAYQAARAGLEYGVAQVLAGNGCNGFGLDGFAIGVTCVAQAGVLVPEENQAVRFYTITASAEYGASGSPDYAYRRLTAVVEH
jgi:MSHA biogenesis protein MshP